MVVDFLKKYQEELILDRIDLKEDLDLLQIKINEESKFLAMLEENNDTYYNVFTPRPVNEKNNIKAAEIKDSLNNLHSELEKITESIKFYDSRIAEINSLISGFSNRQTITSANEPSNLELNRNNNDGLIEKLSLIKTYIFQDPQRATLEIDSLIDILNK